MASVLKLIFDGRVSPETVIIWIQQSLKEEPPECLKDLPGVHQEFVPFFLNYLRDQTLHLLQSSKSTTPSPAKTPSIKKFQSSAHTRLHHVGKKRQQLFGSSPSTEVDELKNFPASVFSPNTSIDSPGLVNKTALIHKGGGSRSHYASQKGSPRCGSQNSASDQDHLRSKQKLSFGEFFCTPEHSHGSGGWKRSPHSTGKRDVVADGSPSPVVSRKSGGRKKHNHSPLVHNSDRRTDYVDTPSPPVFSLTSTNDFPPMKLQGSPTAVDSILIKPEPNNNCDTRISRAINFCDVLEKSHQVQLTAEAKKYTSVGTKKMITSETPAKSSRRRITPTQLKTDTLVVQNAAFLVPVKETDEPKKGPDTSFSLRMAEKSSGVAKNKINPRPEVCVSEHCTNKSHSEPSVVTPTKLRMEHSNSIELVEAKLGEITHQEKLDLLISLYSQCLSGNLLPNLAVEFYFLCQLLTARGGEQGDFSTVFGEDLVEKNYFSTVHNAVYFAVSILEKQKRLLHILDKGTLRLLSENLRIIVFSPSLHTFLEDIYNRAESQKLQAFPRSPIGSVSFQADTDNRRNFPNDRSFHLFKRQRDGFYELIREWEAGHLNPDWNTSDVFKVKVKALVNFKTELVNHMHFARLFQSQLLAVSELLQNINQMLIRYCCSSADRVKLLLAISCIARMCKGDGSVRRDDDDEDIALLSQLKQTNPEKFKRLQERFIKPLGVGGPCPPPSFPGCQEFFHDFIMAACNPVFNQHLTDTFSAKVLELNSWNFNSQNEDDAVTTHEDEEERDQFFSIVMSLRLVGKFLGFVTFLPYQTSDRLPDNLEASYIAVRNKQPLLLDMGDCLRECVRKGHLTLTVPWIIEFLSMMDTVAPRLDHYQLLLLSLLYIHRCMWNQMMNGEVTYSSVMIVAMISWLFDNPIFPEGLFFSNIPETVIQDLGSMTSLGGLDSSLVNQTLLYTCCPYIGEIKALLVEFAVGTNSKASTIRKITPVSADIPTPKSITERQLQLQMEENFFHNHPASMKRVVDFVADRTASNFIKKFRGNLLQNSISDGKDKVLKQLVEKADGSPSSKLKDRVVQVTQRLAQDVHSRVRSQVAQEAGSYCSERIPMLMVSLLPDDQSTVVVDVASSISARMAEEKILQWMNKHITTGMFQTEFLPDMEKVNKSISNQTQKTETVEPDTKTDVNQSSHVTASTHNNKLPHPSDVLIELKDSIKALSLKNTTLTAKKISSLLDATQCTLDQRQDVLPALRRSFSQLTLELLIAIIVKQPNLYSTDILDQCMVLWRGPLKNSTISQALCGRVVLMIQQSVNQDVSWRLYKEFLVKLVQSDAVSIAVIQENCLKLVQSIEDMGTLRHVAMCVHGMADQLTEKCRTEELGKCLDWFYQLLAETN